MLLGRETELARLRALLHDARDGRSFALVVHGDAGIGKTALLLQIAEEAARDGFRLLPVRTYEGAGEIPWAGLHALAMPFLDLLDQLPDVQARALRSALSLEPSVAQDRFTVPVALLGLLAAAAERQPLLVIADDVQWLDRATRDALLFAARRLGAEGVGLLLAARDGEGWEATESRIDALHLPGLRVEDARRLVEGEVAPTVAEALHAATGGNPLALTELPAALTERERTGRDPLRTPLPTGTRVEELFARRIADLPEEARHALGLAAAMNPPRADMLRRAMADLRLPPSALTEAERAGALRLGDGTLAFRHPLVRAAAYHGLSEPDRSRVHAALAAVAPDDRVRAWHLAAAASGPDEAVAAALEAAALDARDRGAPVEAAHAFRHAAGLSPDRADARRRMLDACSDALVGGDSERALHDLAELEEDPGLEPELRSEVRRLRGLAAMRLGTPREGIELVEQEAAELEAAGRPVEAAQTLLLAAAGYLGEGDMVALAATARRARELAGDVPGIRAACDVVEGEALVPLGRPLEGFALIDAGLPLLDPAGEDAAEIVQMVAHAQVWTERYDQAFDLTDDLIREAREAGAVTRLVYPLAVRSDLEQRRGHWQSARADAEEAVRLGADVGFGGNLGLALAKLARIEGLTGRLEEARGHGREGLAMVLAVDYGALEVHARSALGLVELIAGELDAALEQLRGALGRYEELRWGEPSLTQFHADLIEALVAAERHEEAEAVLERFARDADRTQLVWSRAAVERCRGLLAADDAFEAHFARALELHTQGGQPFEEARTDLLLGERLRRAGRRPDSREPLRRALEHFERLGAKPWAERARRAAAASGGTTAVAQEDAAAAAATARRAAIAQLSGQEWRIALLVAQGMTNREAGAALFLSPKTIEHHLSGIYKKLGVRSRTQLARVVADEADRPPVAAL